MSKILLATAAACVFSVFALNGCGNGEVEEAKKLGFSSVEEMKEIHAKGWHTKQRFLADNPNISEEPKTKKVVAKNSAGNSDAAHNDNALTQDPGEKDRELALRYWRGDGVPEDVDKAIELLRISAGKGNKAAKQNLETLENARAQLISKRPASVAESTSATSGSQSANESVFNEGACAGSMSMALKMGISLQDFGTTAIEHSVRVSKKYSSTEKRWLSVATGCFMAGVPIQRTYECLANRISDNSAYNYFKGAFAASNSMATKSLNQVLFETNILCNSVTP